MEFLVIGYLVNWFRRLCGAVWAAMPVRRDEWGRSVFLDADGQEVLADGRPWAPPTPQEGGDPSPPQPADTDTYTLGGGNFSDLEEIDEIYFG